MRSDSSAPALNFTTFFASIVIISFGYEPDSGEGRFGDDG